MQSPGIAGTPTSTNRTPACRAKPPQHPAPMPRPPLQRHDQLAVRGLDKRVASLRGRCGGGLLPRIAGHAPGRLAYACSAEASISHESPGRSVSRAQIAAAYGLKVDEVVPLWEDRNNMCHRHKAPYQVGEVVLGGVLRVDGLKVALHGVHPRGDIKAAPHPTGWVLELEGAKLVVDTQSLESNCGNHVDAAALHRELPEERLELRVILFVGDPHDRGIQVLLVERLTLGRSLVRAILGVEKAVDLSGSHRQPAGHEEEVPAVLGSQTLTLGLQEERVGDVDEVPEVEARKLGRALVSVAHHGLHLREVPVDEDPHVINPVAGSEVLLAATPLLAGHRVLEDPDVVNLDA
mmetsp:Transcript_95168/g.284169  ORF Transcript_95168/g.284169 Transcript_95168/m.284169 type:complete len:350 (+) Transcript_95168:83-1132(+)